METSNTAVEALEMWLYRRITIKFFADKSCTPNDTNDNKKKKNTNYYISV